MIRVAALLLAFLVPCGTGLAVNAGSDIKGAPAPAEPSVKEYTLQDAVAECPAPAFVMPVTLQAQNKEAILIFCVTPTKNMKEPTKWFYKLLHVVVPPAREVPPVTDL